MSSLFISLEPKSQLTINLALKRKQKKRGKEEKRRKFPIKRIGRKRKEKIPNQKGGRKQKEKIPNRRTGENKKRKIPDQRSEENRRNIQKGLWTRQHLNKYRVIAK